MIYTGYDATVNYQPVLTASTTAAVGSAGGGTGDATAVLADGTAVLHPGASITVNGQTGTVTSSRIDLPSFYEGDVATTAGTWPVRYVASTSPTVTYKVSFPWATYPTTGGPLALTDAQWGQAVLRSERASQNVMTTLGATTTSLTSWNYSATGATTADITFCAMPSGSLWHPVQYAAGRPRTPGEKLAQLLAARHAPAVGRGRLAVGAAAQRGLRPTDDFREFRARETLERVVGPEKFRRYLRDGFVTVRGKSGRTYQIFPGNGFTRVHEKGKEVARLCVLLAGNFPPTDSLITRFLYLLHNEEGFLKLAVKQGVHRPAEFAESPVDRRPLPDVFRELRAASAVA